MATLSSGVRLAMITVIFSWSFVSSPEFFLTAFSITSFQLLYFAVVLHFPATLSTSHLTKSSHRILGLPFLLFHPFSGHLISANISSPILSTCPTLFSMFFCCKSTLSRSCCFSVSVIVSKPCMYASATNEVSTCPKGHLTSRDTRPPSPHYSLLQASAPP